MRSPVFLCSVLVGGVLAGMALPSAQAQQTQSAPAAANASANAANAAKSTPPPITIFLKDGQTISPVGVRRAGSSIMATVQTADGRTGEVGYDVANVQRIDFPDPGQLKIADDLLKQGRADEALKQLAPVLAYYLPFRDLAGGWWNDLALLQLEALNRLGRTADADAVAADMARMVPVPQPLQRAVKIQQGVSLQRRGENQKALGILEGIIKDENAPPESLPEAWLSAGAANLALGKDKPALLAYLHVPVYVPERALAMAPALLGSAAAYVRLDDKTRARTTLQQLVTAYPKSPEAAEAKDRLQKLGGSDAPGAKEPAATNN